MRRKVIRLHSTAAASPQVTGGGGQRLQEGAEGLELGEAETGCDLYTVEKIGEGKTETNLQTGIKLTQVLY